MVGVFSAPSGVIDGETGLQQVFWLGAGAGGIERGMLKQPNFLARVTGANGGGLGLHLGQGFGIGDRSVGNSPGHGLVGAIFMH